MAKTTTATPTNLKLTITLPEALADTYSERALKHGRTVEDEIALRLKACQAHTAAQPIYVDDEGRQSLSRIAGKVIRTQGELLAWATGLTQITVGGTFITLDETLVTRLQSRADAMSATLSEYIHQCTIEALEREVGLR